MTSLLSNNTSNSNGWTWESKDCLNSCECCHALEPVPSESSAVSKKLVQPLKSPVSRGLTSEKK